MIDYILARKGFGQHNDFTLYYNNYARPTR
jgi:hypothetical protein